MNDNYNNNDDNYNDENCNDNNYADDSYVYDYYNQAQPQSPRRPRLYDDLADGARRTPRSAHASLLERLQETLQRRKAMPAIAVGLTAIIGIGGMTALANAASGSASAGEPIEGVAAVTDPATTGSDAVVNPSSGGLGAGLNGYQLSTMPNGYDLSTMPRPTPTTSTTPPPPPTTTTSTTPPTTTSTTSTTSIPPTTSTTTTPPTTSTTTTTTTTSTVPPVPNEPVLFWNDLYVGYWEGSEFVAQIDQNISPNWLIGTPLVLLNQSNVTRNSTAVWCEMAVVLQPGVGVSNTADSYWHAGDISFTVLETDESTTTAAMNDALLAEGLDPERTGSYGAPLAADGSADRLLWYVDNDGTILWLATFDVETASFFTIDGDPVDGMSYEISRPSQAWVDLDGDGNLESMYGSGDGFTLMEWANGGPIWMAGPVQHQCS